MPPLGDAVEMIRAAKKKAAKAKKELLAARRPKTVQGVGDPATGGAVVGPAPDPPEIQELVDLAKRIDPECRELGVSSDPLVHVLDKVREDRDLDAAHTAFAEFTRRMAEITEIDGGTSTRDSFSFKRKLFVANWDDDEVARYARWVSS